MNRLQLETADGFPLAVTRFDPAGEPRSVVVIAPAMAVSQSFYAQFAAWLAQQGYATLTFDYRGWRCWSRAG